MSGENEQANWIRQIGILTAIPVLLAVGPFLGYVAGHWLDNRLNTEPIFTIILLIFGFVASGKETYGLIKKASRDLNKK